MAYYVFDGLGLSERCDDDWPDTDSTVRALPASYVAYIQDTERRWTHKGHLTKEEHAAHIRQLQRVWEAQERGVLI